MGRSCTELWTNDNYVLKFTALSFLLGVEFFVQDSYFKFYRFYAFTNGYFFAAFINIVIVLYGYTWFDTTLIWECCMIICTILMLIISTFAFTHDYLFDDDYMIKFYADKNYQFNGRSFAISATLSMISIVILIIDLILLILRAKGKRFGGGRSRGGVAHQQQQSRPAVNEE